MGSIIPFRRRRQKANKLTSEEKSVLASYYSSLWHHQAGLHRARDWPIERAVTEGYERVIWVFKAVNQIGADHSRLPFRIRQDDTILKDHPLYRVLNKQANPLETGQVFRKRLSAQILLSKRGAFVQKTISNGGTIKRLDLLPPDRMNPIPSEDGKVMLDHWELTLATGGVKELGPDEVAWFRDPHPIDPYSGVTPLEAAGLSVELDYFARLYNATFLRNDGRPGGVLAVRGANPSAPVDEAIMNRIESRFGSGPAEAGKLSVVAGELSYVDLAARPRDMQYGQTASNAKVEILSAFGMSESVIGYAADRTFDNASQEHYNYWTVTQASHGEIIVTGFDEDSEDDMEGFLDTSKIEVLQRAEIARRDEARTEVAAGLRSIKSYADLAGYGDEVEDTVYTRSLYMPQGRTPLPSKAGDIDALGLGTETTPAPALSAGTSTGAAALPPGAAPDAAQTPPDAAAPVGQEAAGAQATGDAAGKPQGAAAAALAALSPGNSAGGTHLSVVPAPGESKRARPTRRAVMQIERGPANEDDVVESDIDQRARDRLEDTVAAALGALGSRWIERTVARIKSTKARKGTRHWQADPALPSDTRGGTKALDSAKAVDEERWSDEAETGTEPIVKAAAIVAATALIADLGEDDDHDAAAITAATVAMLMLLIRASAAKQAVKLVQIINDADQNGASMDEIEDQIREHARVLGNWADGLAVQVATATINGARDAAAADVAATTADQIERTWLTRRDDRVRHSHEETDGQKQPVGQPFIVGDSLLRFPCDPLAPVKETAGCRCRLLHRSKRSGRFVPVPVAVSA